MLFNAWVIVMAQVRLERGLSREQAAANAGVSTSTWYRWESSPNGPGGHQLATVARGLGVTEDEVAHRYAEVLLRHYERRRLEAEGAVEPRPGTINRRRRRRPCKAWRRPTAWSWSTSTTSSTS